MTKERAIQILNPEHREQYKSIEPVNEACLIGIEAIKKQIPKPTFQYRCGVCELELSECDWGDENACLSDDKEKGFKYCPRCGQAIDWSKDDLFDKTIEVDERKDKLILFEEANKCCT